jgi:hypothetical protein
MRYLFCACTWPGSVRCKANLFPRYLTEHLPHKALRVILLIWSLDQSAQTMQGLSAGEIENLLSRNGTEMIPLVEAEACRDRSFAKLLGGVWKNRMTDEVRSRLQAVWDRRGWDDIPEESTFSPTVRIGPG